MNKPPKSNWKKKLNTVNNLMPLAVLLLLAGYVLFLMQIMDVDLVQDLSPRIGIGLLGLGCVLILALGLVKNRAWREAFKDVLAREHSIPRIARILGIRPRRCEKEITRLIKQGKLNALYVDTEKGLVVRNDNETGQDAQASSDSFTPGLTSEILTVSCPGCGALNRVQRGKNTECEYCGAVVTGNQ